MRKIVNATCVDRAGLVYEAPGPIEMVFDGDVLLEPEVARRDWQAPTRVQLRYPPANDVRCLVALIPQAA